MLDRGTAPLVDALFPIPNTSLMDHDEPTADEEPSLRSLVSEIESDMLVSFGTSSQMPLLSDESPLPPLEFETKDSSELELSGFDACGLDSILPEHSLSPVAAAVLAGDLATLQVRHPYQSRVRCSILPFFG